MNPRPIERVDADLLACSCSPAVVSRGAMLGERTPLTVNLENGLHKPMVAAWPLMTLTGGVACEH